MHEPTSPKLQESEVPSDPLAYIVGYLSSVPAWYLATSVHGIPHVRPFSFIASDNGRLWFCTATAKDVFDELIDNPHWEGCAYKPGCGWLILRGCAQFGEPPRSIRTAGFRHLCSLGESYESEDDARLAFYTLAQGAVELCDIDGSRHVIYAVA